MQEDLMSVRLINQWLKLIESDKLSNISDSTVAYILVTLKDVIIEENQILVTLKDIIIESNQK